MLAFLGGADIVLILVVCLLIFGPKKLPELARGLGQGLREFKKASNDVMEQVMVDPEPASTSSTARPWRPAPAQLTVDAVATREHQADPASPAAISEIHSELHANEPAHTAHTAHAVLVASSEVSPAPSLSPSPSPSPAAAVSARPSI